MWIQEYREREKLELWQFQQRVNEFSKESSVPLQGIVSERLIHTLETINTVTNPHIANIIAVLCGATPEQRDMIVSEPHKGKWKPTNKDKMLASKINSKPFIKGVDYHRYNKRIMYSSNTPWLESYAIEQPISSKKAVVKIDMNGNTLDRYETMSETADANNTTRDVIRTRCNRSIKREFGIFKTKLGKTDFKYTFRYANEWDKMTQQEKIKDVRRTLED